jgi:hypothetical protein
VALEAATEKLEEYYNETAASDTHIISMGNVILFFISFFPGLHPAKKNWRISRNTGASLSQDLDDIKVLLHVIGLFLSLTV